MASVRAIQRLSRPLRASVASTASTVATPLPQIYMASYLRMECASSARGKPQMAVPHRMPQRAFAASSSPPPAAPEAPTTASVKIEPKLLIVFTCDVCKLRAKKQMSRVAYEKGATWPRCALAHARAAALHCRGRHHPLRRLRQPPPHCGPPGVYACACACPVARPAVFTAALQGWFDDNRLTIEDIMRERGKQFAKARVAGQHCATFLTLRAARRAGDHERRCPGCSYCRRACAGDARGCRRAGRLAVRLRSAAVLLLNSSHCAPTCRAKLGKASKPPQ
jgi:hypothetical protein